jgi:CheY-like chemotaxis protein/REP element-mobilizing transposase RayT
MPLVSTRLLVINRQLDFSINIKRALEQIGGYEVASFISADAALEFLRNRPQDVALVDFTLKDISGETLVAQIRDIQPDIAVIASPINSVTNRALIELDLQGVVPAPVSARELIPVLARAVSYTLDTETADVSMLSNKPEGLPSFTEQGEIINPIPNGTETMEVDMSDIAPQVNIFHQLAAEEPPMPGLEENGTVSQLKVTMTDTGVREVVEILKENIEIAEPIPLPPDDGDEPEIPALARQILETALPSFSEAVEMDEEESIALQAELGKLNVEPVDESRVAQLALDLTQASLELTAEATLLTQGNEIIAQAGEMPVEDIYDIKVMIGGDWDSNDTQSRIRFVTLPGSGKDYMLFSRRTEFGFTLTMIFAGNMPLRVIRRQSERLLKALQAVPEETQVEAVMQTPLETLEIPIAEMEPERTAVEQQPVVEPPAVAVAVVKPEVLTPYTFIWMLQNPEEPLGDAIAQAVIAGLDLTLSQKAWSIHTLRVHEDYIYLYSDVPGEQSPHDVIPELKRLSAEIAQAKNPAVDADGLWADAYLTLMPGRELDTQEVERFIRFVRFP